MYICSTPPFKIHLEGYATYISVIYYHHYNFRLVAPQLPFGFFVDLTIWNSLELVASSVIFPSKLPSPAYLSISISISSVIAFCQSCFSSVKISSLSEYFVAFNPYLPKVETFVFFTKRFCFLHSNPSLW